MSAKQIKFMPLPPEQPKPSNRYKRQITFESEVTDRIETKVNQSFDGSMLSRKRPSISAFTPIQSRPISQLTSIQPPSRPGSVLKKKVTFHDKSFSLNASHNISTNANTSFQHSNDTFLMNRVRFKQKLEEKSISHSSDMGGRKPSEKESLYRKKRREGKVKMYKRDELQDDKIFILEKLGRHEPQIFKERHISEVANKIKRLMNHTDNVFANEVHKILPNKNLAKRAIAKFGIAHKDYVKEFPAYVHFYGKHIEDTVIGLTRELKREMVDRDIVKMLIEKNQERKIQPRPYLYSFGFKIDAFLRERKLKSITQYLRKHEEEIWGALKKKPDELLDYISCGGDYKVAEIMKAMDSPERKNMTTESSVLSGGALLTTDDSRGASTEDSFITKKFAHLDNLLDENSLKKSKMLYNKTRGMIENMKLKIDELEELESRSKSTLH